MEEDPFGHHYSSVPTLVSGKIGTQKQKQMRLFQKKNRSRNVAIKLIKNIEKYRKAAKFEILVLNKLNKWDPYGKQ